MSCSLSVINFKSVSFLEDKIEVPNSIFDVEVNHKVLQLVTLWQNHRDEKFSSVKNPGSVKRTTAKSRPQKGTGGARHGSLSAPQFRGGGVVLGPYPIASKHSLNKKVRKLALKMMLTSALRENRLFLIEGLSMEKPKTSEFHLFLEKLFGSDLKTIFRFYVKSIDQNTLLSVRNIRRAHMLSVKGINVYDMIRAKNIILDRPALDEIISMLS